MTSKRIDVSSLPAWPRLLNKALAAAYCSSSPGHFDTHIAPHITNIRIGYSVRFDKHEIDKFIDRKQQRAAGYTTAEEALENLNK
jgi:hypothetical protein